jgi:hypothetical protein
MEYYSSKCLGRDTHPGDTSHVRLPHAQAQAGHVRASMVGLLTFNYCHWQRKVQPVSGDLLEKSRSCYLAFQILLFVSQ